MSVVLEIACWVEIDCRRPSRDEILRLDTCDYCFAHRDLDDVDDGDLLVSEADAARLHRASHTGTVQIEQTHLQNQDHSLRQKLIDADPDDVAPGGDA